MPDKKYRSSRQVQSIRPGIHVFLGKVLDRDLLQRVVDQDAGAFKSVAVFGFGEFAGQGQGRMILQQFAGIVFDDDIQAEQVGIRIKRVVFFDGDAGRRCPQKGDFPGAVPNLQAVGGDGGQKHRIRKIRNAVFRKGKMKRSGIGQA